MGKKTKHSAIKRDPAILGQPGLNFGQGEYIEPTDEQKASAFISRYLDHMKEDNLYEEKLERYFKGSAKDWAWELRDFKLYYKQLVLSGKWAEEKFIAVLDGIISDVQVVNAVTFDIRGKWYDRSETGRPDASRQSRRRGRV